MTPSHQQKLEAIREKVIAAVPEIVELKFGCVLKDQCGYGYTVWRVFPRNPNGTQGVKTDVDQIEDISSYKIIGRPIGLQDVLRVFTHFSLPDLDISLVGNPAPGLCGLVMTVKKKSAIWKLDRTLKEQAPETIDFIHSLLCE